MCFSFPCVDEFCFEDESSHRFDKMLITEEFEVLGSEFVHMKFVLSANSETFPLESGLWGVLDMILWSFLLGRINWRSLISVCRYNGSICENLIALIVYRLHVSLSLAIF